MNYAFWSQLYQDKDKIGSAADPSIEQKARNKGLGKWMHIHVCVNINSYISIDFLKRFFIYMVK